MKFVSGDNLKYFKTKQDSANDNRFAAKTAIPTNVSQLANDSGYQTASDLQTAINQAISSVMTYRGSKDDVSQLPTTGNKVGDVWHVVADASEYAWDGSKWEVLGSTMNVSVDWGSITGKPSEFKPEAHNHQMTDVTGLDIALQGKADTSHKHGAADITGLDTMLAGKADTVHSHSTTEVTGLDEALSGKANVSHTHATGEITGLDTALAGKADAAHTHTEASTSAAGFMSAADKTKLDGLEQMVELTSEEIDDIFK